MDTLFMYYYPVKDFYSFVLYKYKLTERLFERVCNSLEAKWLWLA